MVKKKTTTKRKFDKKSYTQYEAEMVYEEIERVYNPKKIICANEHTLYEQFRIPRTIRKSEKGRTPKHSTSTTLSKQKIYDIVKDLKKEGKIKKEIGRGQRANRLIPIKMTERSKGRFTGAVMEERQLRKRVIALEKKERKFTVNDFDELFTLQEEIERFPVSTGYKLSLQYHEKYFAGANAISKGLLKQLKEIKKRQSKNYNLDAEKMYSYRLKLTSNSTIHLFNNIPTGNSKEARRIRDAIKSMNHHVKS